MTMKKRAYEKPKLIKHGKVLALTNGASPGTNDPGGANNGGRPK